MEILYNKQPQTFKELNNTHLFIPHHCAQVLVARLAFSPSQPSDEVILLIMVGSLTCQGRTRAGCRSALAGRIGRLWFYFMCLSTTSRLAWPCAELVARQEQWQTITCPFFPSPECTNMTNILLRKAKSHSWIQNQGVGKYMPFFFEIRHAESYGMWMER